MSSPCWGPWSTAKVRNNLETSKLFGAFFIDYGTFLSQLAMIFNDYCVINKPSENILTSNLPRTYP